MARPPPDAADFADASDDGRDGRRRASAAASEKGSGRPSRDIIYEAMMRGGSAFGAPFVQGVASLTERVVQKFKQRSFFGFETFERTQDSAATAPEALRPNKFTRYGAGRYFGPYRKPPR